MGVGLPVPLALGVAAALPLAGALGDKGLGDAVPPTLSVALGVGVGMGAVVPPAVPVGLPLGEGVPVGGGVPLPLGVPLRLPVPVLLGAPLGLVCVCVVREVAEGGSEPAAVAEGLRARGQGRAQAERARAAAAVR